MKESQPIPAIAVSLATSLVAAPYLLIRNDYHKKVAPISNGAYALHDFLMLWRRLNLASNPSQQASKVLSPFFSETQIENSPHGTGVWGCHTTFIRYLVWILRPSLWILRPSLCSQRPAFTELRFHRPKRSPLKVELGVEAMHLARLLFALFSTRLTFSFRLFSSTKAGTNQAQFSPMIELR